MRAVARRQTYRPKRTTGLATMRDLWHLAVWVGDRLNQDVQMEGISRVRDTTAGVFIAASNDGKTQSITPQRASYRFKRRKGLARRQDLADYAQWLSAQIKDSISGAGIEGRADANGGRLTFMQ